MFRHSPSTLFAIIASVLALAAPVEPSFLATAELVAFYPGSGEDFELTVTTGTLESLQLGLPLSAATLVLHTESPGGAFLGDLYVVGAQVLQSGDPMLLGENKQVNFSSPDTLILTADNATVSVGGDDLKFPVSPDVVGKDVLVQGVVFSAAAGNGAFALTEARRIRVAP